MCVVCIEVANQCIWYETSGHNVLFESQCFVKQLSSNDLHFLACISFVSYYPCMVYRMAYFSRDLNFANDNKICFYKTVFREKVSVV